MQLRITLLKISPSFNSNPYRNKIQFAQKYEVYFNALLGAEHFTFKALSTQSANQLHGKGSVIILTYTDKLQRRFSRVQSTNIAAFGEKNERIRERYESPIGKSCFGFSMSPLVQRQQTLDYAHRKLAN